MINVLIKGFINLIVFLIEAFVARYLMSLFCDDPVSLDKAILYVILAEIAFSSVVYSKEDTKENISSDIKQNNEKEEKNADNQETSI